MAALGGKHSTLAQWERRSPLPCKLHRSWVYRSGCSEQFFFQFQSSSEDGLHVIFTFITNSHEADPTRKTTKMYLQASSSLGGGDKETIRLSHGRERKKTVSPQSFERRSGTVTSFIVGLRVRGHVKALCVLWMGTHKSFGSSGASWVLRGKSS